MRDINRKLTEVNGELFVPRSLESDECFLRSHRLGEQGHKQAKGTHLWGTAVYRCSRFASTPHVTVRKDRPKNPNLSP